MSLHLDAERVLQPDGPICLVPSNEIETVTDVVSDAFRQYPVPLFVLDDSMPDPGEGMRPLISFFVMARALRREPIFSVARNGTRIGVALVSDPDGPPAPPEFSSLREQTWARLGPDVRRRYEQFGEATRAFAVDEPHLHLNILAVRRAHHGEGIGRLLLNAVHALAESTPRFRGVTLTTESPANLGLYQHFGYEVVGHARVGDGLETWGLYRRNP